MAEREFVSAGRRRKPNGGYTAVVAYSRRGRLRKEEAKVDRDITKLAGVAEALSNDADLETFVLLVDEVSQELETMFDDWQPALRKDRARAYTTNDLEEGGVGHSIWQQIWRRNGTDARPATEVLNTQAGWEKLGGTVRDDGIPIVAVSSADAAAMSASGEMPPQDEWLYDLADVEGVDTEKYLDFPPAPLPAETAEKMWHQLESAADDLGVEVELAVPPAPYNPPFMSPLPNIDICGGYVAAQKKIYIHPAVPAEHRAVILAHEMIHAYDTPQGVDAIADDDELAFAITEGEVVAELANFAVIRNQGGSTYQENAAQVSNQLDRLRQSDLYHDELPSEIGGRVSQAIEFIESYLD